MSFSMDMTGYGRSRARPPMSDRCNFSRRRNRRSFSEPHSVPSAAFASSPITTMDSDWNASERSSITCGAAASPGQGIDRGLAQGAPRGAGLCGGATPAKWARLVRARRLPTLARPPSKRQTRFRPAAVQ